VIVRWFTRLLTLGVLVLHAAVAQAFTLNVVDGAGKPVSGFRYLVQEDNTSQPTLPTASVAPKLDGVSLDIHKSYAPVVTTGRSDGASAVIDLPADQRYFVSVLPYAGYSNSGAPVLAGQDTATVAVDLLPLPTAQISVLAFVDHAPVNNIYDPAESGLGGCNIQLSEAAGRMSQDAFGNPLGTRYQFTDTNANGFHDEGEAVNLDIDGNPLVLTLGNGTLTTLTLNDFCAAKGFLADPLTNSCSATTITADPSRNLYNVKVGEVLIKYILPGKYGIIVVPPGADDTASPMSWSQTATIEGTPTVDAWVKANEPSLFVEGFGVGFNHAFFGFVKTSPVTPSLYRGQTIPALPWNVAMPTNGGTPYTGSITGTLRLNHFSRPPNLQGYFAGEPVSGGWVGLNDPATGLGLYATPCDADGNFVIDGIPPGTYQLVNWDDPLDFLFGFRTVTIGPGTGTGEALALGNVLVFRWFGTFQGSVFLDDGAGSPANAGNGLRDPGEIGIPEQNVNIRFRNGTVYQAQPTDINGEFEFGEVFPFFKWLVTEVDFARFKATGATNVVDNGGDPLGAVLPAGPVGVGKLAPQPQRLADGAPFEGADYRTVQGEVLTQAMHLFLGQTNHTDWGKSEYAVGENGGISGIVYYAITRAENDPRYAVGEPWEPGIPRVVLNLYRDRDGNGIVDDLDGDGLPILADADNFPFQWAPVHRFLDDGSFNPEWTGVKGAEDVDRNGNGVWNPGDALNTTTTDSFDDNRPSGCIQDLPVIRGEQVPECADAFGTWNQIRDGVFDGGYAFNSYFPGGMVAGLAEVDGLPTDTYIVEAVTPPNYELLKEEDKNVDFGLSFTPSPLVLPALCVGEPHAIPPYLSFNTIDGTTQLPGVDPLERVSGFYAGQTRPLCNMKQVTAAEAKNAATDFFYFTQVPIAARAVGFANNDLGAEFNQASPNFGEKLSPSWMPVSFHDWTGREISRVYIDEFGSYNALLPSTFTVNVPAPSGVSPNMLTLILNNPTKPDGSKDPYYNPTYSVTPWTFHYMPGSPSYLDTPLVPLAAFAVNEVKLDTAAAEGTPVIGSVSGTALENGAGALICTDLAGARTLTIISAGQVELINPEFNPSVPGIPYLITRDYSFGPVVGQVMLGDVPLTLISWTPDKIVATVPGTVLDGTYQLTVTRGDNGRTTQPGETVFLADCGATAVHLATEDLTPGSHPIQDAIDAAGPGDLILVGPGTFNENVIMYKPVHLQGAGVGKTFINGNPTPTERLTAWYDKLDTLGAAAVVALLGTNPFAENEAPGIVVFGETVFTDPITLAAATLNPGNPFVVPAQIDGFTISGSKAGGGIHVLSGAANLVISNNEITGNQGNYAGGIATGITGAIPAGYPNANLVIRDNHIHKNGGVQGAGGIAIQDYTNDYTIENNLIEGNFSRFNGGGIAHVDFSAGDNVIRNNRILFNEDFFGALLNQAGDGAGIFVGSLPVIDPVTGLPVPATGTGNVTIEGNLIQGNLAGSGNGGGIRAYAVNGDDVLNAPDGPTQWYQLRLYNNIIANNVAGLAGAGISLQDVLRATIVNNTIVHNDTTATSVLAFQAGAADSTPQPAGIASGAHSSTLLASIDFVALPTEPTFSSPVLVNNIILENRSFFTTNGGAGGLTANTTSPYWDMGVTGTTTPEFLNPLNSLLTSLTDTQVPAHNYDASNLAADPTVPVFRRAYLNALESAQVVDEGGNNINVRFTPITALAGDYHLRATSPALDAGDDAAAPATDIDGQNRPNGTTDIGADEFYPVPPTQIGVWRQGFWYLDQNGNYSWDGDTDIRSEKLNLPASQPVTADWDGDGRTEVGFYSQGTWYLDRNGDGVWSGDGADEVLAYFGAPTDLGVTADIDDDGTVELGVYRPSTGMWYFDLDNDGWGGCTTDVPAGTDLCLGPFGAPGDLPVVANMDADITPEIGVFRPSTGMWYFDLDNDGWTGCEADLGTDRCLGPFGAPGDLPVVADMDADITQEIGVFRPSTGMWYFDLDNDGWTLCQADSGTDLCAGPFGAPGDKPVLGDWDGDNRVAIGVYRPVPGTWYLDNGDGKWDLVNGIDVLMDTFGAPTDLPIAGDWDGDGITTIATYRQGQWLLGTADGFMRGTVAWNGSLIDVADANFGAPTDLPVAGDWNGDGKAQIGVYRQGQWFLDFNGNRQWDADLDKVIAAFGAPTDLPVAGDVDGDGISEIGVYRPSTGQWYFDLDNDGWGGCTTDVPAGTDLCLGPFGAPTDKPVTGDWNSDGVAEIGVYRQGTWYIDFNGSGTWEDPATAPDPATADQVHNNFGGAADIPVTGIWQQPPVIID